MANKNIPTIQTIRGNVGIGETNPAHKLDVAGSSRFQNSVYIDTNTGSDALFVTRLGTASESLKIYTTDSASVFETIQDETTTTYGSMAFKLDSGAPDPDFSFWYGESVRFRIEGGTGNVGIGTASPNALLHITKNDDTVYDPTADDGQRGIGATIQLNNNSTTTNTFGQIMYDTDSSGQAVARIVFLDAGTASSAMAFVTETGESKGERMRISPGGLVGIGTDSPLYRLDVHNAGSGIRHYGNATNQLSTYCYGAYQVMIATNGTITNEFGYAAGNFYVQTNDTEQFRITSAGNVGIGTTSPTTWKLSVDSSDIYAASFDTSNNVGVVINGNNTTASQIIGFSNSNSTYNELHLRTNSTSTDGLYIDASGNVGIGTTQPGQMLDVDGNIECDSLYLNNASSLYFGPAFFGARIKANCGGLLVQDGSTYQAVYASAFSVQSDYRLKSNVVPLDNAIDRLKQMSVHRFNWNDRLDEPKVDGFIAHELSEVVPEAVLGEKDATKEDGTPDYQGIDQSKIVPLLTAALQDAITKIEQLETRIQTLENND